MRVSHIMPYNNHFLQITVSYDEKENSVIDILSVWYFNGNSTQSLTDLFKNIIPDQLEEIVQKIDWREVYRERKAA